MSTETTETDGIAKTERLVLRRFALSDAPAVQRLCDNWAIASVTARIPHPYTLEDAEAWISGQVAALEQELPVAITFDGTLVGSTGLVGEADSFELGYWIGEPWWGRGFATEAAHAMCAYAFDSLDAKRMTSGHFIGNDASARVLAKCGFRYVGTEQQYALALDKDVETLRMVLDRDEWQGATGGDGT